MTDAVSALVLRNNYQQTQIISLVQRDTIYRFSEYLRLIKKMEESGQIMRGMEFIPSDEELIERRASTHV